MNITTVNSIVTAFTARLSLMVLLIIQFYSIEFVFINVPNQQQLQKHLVIQTQITNDKKIKRDTYETNKTNNGIHKP